VKNPVHVSLFALVGLLTAAPVLAGGSDVQVRVVSFVSSSDTDYTMVVTPVTPSQPEPYPDPYMGHCLRFTVIGTYAWLAGFHLTQPPMVTRSAHLDAVKYLRTAADSNETIQFGWMGTGFLIPNAAEPCIVKSRALVLFTDEHGKAVISFYNDI
jgi:hypothetical protein